MLRLGVNQAPPAPSPDASCAPTQSGCPGTISERLVGRAAILRPRDSKSSRASRTGWLIRTRFFSQWVRVCCRALNKPRPPGMASTMLRSSPMTRCHTRVLVRFFPRSDSNISRRRSTRCGGRVMVLLTVSMSHPSMTLVVAQQASPFLSFLTEVGSLCCGCWTGSNGSSTSSMACRRIRRTRVRSRLLPWLRARKSST